MFLFGVQYYFGEMAVEEDDDAAEMMRRETAEALLSLHCVVSEISRGGTSILWHACLLYHHSASHLFLFFPLWGSLQDDLVDELVDQPHSLHEPLKVWSAVERVKPTGGFVNTANTCYVGACLQVSYI